MNKIHLFGALGVALIVLLGQCNGNRHEVVLSEQHIPFRYVNFEKAVFDTPFDSIDGRIPKWAQRYPDFFELYSHQVLQLGGPESRDFNLQFKSFYSYVVNNQIIEAVRREQKLDSGNLIPQLYEALRYYHYHFPKAAIPDVYTYVSGFAQSVVITDAFVGVSVDKYLGVESPFYQRLGLEHYKRLRMYAERIPSDVMWAIASTNYPFNDSIENMMAHMIHEGRMLYFLDAMLPGTPDSVKIGYTAKQMKWVEYNEKEMWDYLIAKKLLFSTDKLEIRKFTGEGPFTATFGQNSPAQVGVWLGWQIVRTYMDTHPEVSLEQLMREKDYQRILRYSEYRP